MQPSSPLHFVLALGLSATVFNVGVSTVTHLAATTPEEAIERAVADRMGSDVSVRVMSLETVVAGESGLQAQVDPAARLGQPTRFVLLGHGGVRKGSAVATLQVEARFARAVRAIARDEAIASDAFEIVNGPLPAMALRRVPDPGEIVGLKARRAIARGEALTSAVLMTPPAVRSGDEVTVKVSIGAVEVTGVGVASGSGQAGDVIRIMQPRSRQLLKARIVGPGMVEIAE
jgi:flagella basal body P-ring formation protein FlgA